MTISSTPGSFFPYLSLTSPWNISDRNTVGSIILLGETRELNMVMSLGCRDKSLVFRPVFFYPFSLQYNRTRFLCWSVLSDFEMIILVLSSYILFCYILKKYGRMNIPPTRARLTSGLSLTSGVRKDTGWMTTPEQILCPGIFDQQIVNSTVLWVCF